MGSLKSNDTVNEELGRINSGKEKIVDMGKENSSKQVESKEAGKDAGANVRSSGSKDDKKGEIKDSGDHASEKKGDKKVKTSGGLGSESGHEVTLSSGRKDGIRGEECDSSYSCNIEEESLVACLRVPGNGMSFTLLYHFFCLLVDHKFPSPFHHSYKMNFTLIPL